MPKEHTYIYYVHATAKAATDMEQQQQPQERKQSRETAKKAEIMANKTYSFLSESS